MDASKLLISCLLLLCVLDLANAHGLKVGFYEKTCPKAEAIVKKVIVETVATTPSLAAPLLRMHFHDCFVRGCEGSILLNSRNNTAEKDSPANSLLLRGYHIIDKAKTALENACPGVVSCADILALAARDATAAVNGAVQFEVETGRRDGYVSNITEAKQQLVPGTANISTLITEWAKRGLNAIDLAVLSGGHTIGMSHCSSFSNRLYNFTGKGDTDPTLDPNYIAKLKMKCVPNDNKTVVEMDPGSVRTFDETYFALVAKRRGLFQSDAALLDNSVTKAYVQKHATVAGRASFFKDFGVSMVKMGKFEVLTGSKGEVRKICSKIN